MYTTGMAVSWTKGYKRHASEPDSNTIKRQRGEQLASDIATEALVEIKLVGEINQHQWLPRTRNRRTMAVMNSGTVMDSNRIFMCP